ncbi:class I SAM-dependent methyltransferase [Pseudoduganella sp. GCM10020061]|uniref:class I SAM-dependent methyltransferase n=1 Tax=Pseudoduganella sp. GCM10020061 TaxID=3317345 RepID=UPI003641340E
MAAVMSGNCVVCESKLVGGHAGWHSVCTACSYEGAALEPCINASVEAKVDEDAREIGLRQIRMENFRDLLDHIDRLCTPSQRKLLDVGCAHGWFLETAQQRFDVLGIEPDEFVAGRTKSRGLPVRVGFFPSVLDDAEQFDVVVFNDVIEHIPDIRAAIAAVHRHLGAGGLLVLNLPNSRGFFYRTAKLLSRLGWTAPFERLWQKDLPSPHVHYFDRRNLARLVASHGFEQVLSIDLPSVRAQGLLERIRCAGTSSTAGVYVQYVAALVSLPLVRMFESDIVVSVFRKQ